MFFVRSIAFGRIHILTHDCFSSLLIRYFEHQSLVVLQMVDDCFLSSLIRLENVMVLFSKRALLNSFRHLILFGECMYSDCLCTLVIFLYVSILL